MSFDLLKNMVSIPSFSREEEKVADYICRWLEEEALEYKRVGNNIILHKGCNIEGAPSILLNSHIDTVKPSPKYTFDPFNPPHTSDTIFGLGSNDAGGSVTAMLYTFKHFSKEDMPFSLGLILSAEEECSGEGGIASLSGYISENYDFAIIGEPTMMKGAIGERGLLVLDGKASGKSGHAARNEGINAIDIAIRDINRLQNFKFDKRSPSMGDIKLSVTQINAGTQHNVIPDTCTFVVDIRTTEQYSSAEIWKMLQSITESELTPRKLTNRSSATPQGHILLEALEINSIEKFVSPTTSDWMKINIPAVKMGPGDSARSHQADEYIYIKEIEEGIRGYTSYINTLGDLIRNGKY
jgi:acetylornithine deacetylase